ncbi:MULTISPECIES: hypothetical protein [unclassified Streptomyces]|uniref:hypothetical protein n=1 Tax=unclassified Streptomyces TaxID=2593676 RepID=UPI0006FB04F3|nr:MULTISPECIES: hypothetical protein [unclassified Streptomyces]KQX50702.1 hypothetical protein ASD33_11605 [Streptomyces sp. Root1304]KRA84867.1 hypothetical protein ASE09_11610 [Streptomyces sp. Root66D1]
MKITEGTLAEGWRRKAAGHVLLHEVGLPPVAFSRAELERWAGDGEEDGLRLLLDEDGTVHGHHGPHLESFATRDLDLVLYLIAEDAMGRRGGSVEEAAHALERIDPVWGRRFRSGGLDEAGTVEACGRDPLDGLAWIAGSWRGQEPYTTLAFFRAAPGESVDAERLALLYGADPAQVAAGTRLKDLKAVDNGRVHWDREWESCCFGRVGEWTFLLHHDSPPGSFADKEAYAALGIRESVWLTATSAKAIYTLDYLRDGRRVDDDWGMLELIWYERGRAPYRRGGELDFLNRAVRRAELDHPELTSTFELYFHALEQSLGLGLPRRDFAEGEVRAAYWAGGER